MHKAIAARRRFLLRAGAGAATCATLAAITGLAGAASLAFAPALSSVALPVRSASETLRDLTGAQPALRQVRTNTVEISYFAAGPEEGRPIVLAQDGRATIGSQAETAALLAAQGYRVLQPRLRHAAALVLGQDLIAFIDALHMPEAVFVGTGRNAAAVQAAARLRATRVIGLALTGNGDTAAGRATATIDLPADATPQQIANAAAALVRQGKWRT
jgi:hypothetical protein